MSLYDDSLYRKNLEHCENIYAEVCNIMNSARELAKSTNYQLRHSQAITCVVQGISPDDMLHCNATLDTTEEDTQISELYCNVSDKRICDAVYDSYFDSKAAGHLIYTYNNVIDESQQSRVRVLTNMLWYSLDNK